MLFFISNFFICMNFRLANTSINTVSYSCLYMLFVLSEELWDVGNVVCYGSGILSMWDVGDVWMLGMWDIGDVWCWGCGMFRMWDLGDVLCWGCAMFRMWYVEDVGCRMRDVCRVVGCWFTKYLKKFISEKMLNPEIMNELENIGKKEQKINKKEI